MTEYYKPNPDPECNDWNFQGRGLQICCVKLPFCELVVLLAFRMGNWRGWRLSSVFIHLWMFWVSGFSTLNFISKIIPIWGRGSHVTITHDALDLTVQGLPLDIRSGTQSLRTSDLLVTSGGDHWRPVQFGNPLGVTTSDCGHWNWGMWDFQAGGTQPTYS